MKVVLLILLCVLIMLYSSCGVKEESIVKKDDVMTKSHSCSPVLQDALTMEYDLRELEKYFKGRNINENIVMNNSLPVLSYSEVNEKFPIEVTRPEGYSVYKVSQGGYFYIFWAISQKENADVKNEDMYVYFSAYLASPANLNDFDMLTPGESTAADVRRVDPNMELSFLRSCGIFSYSFLDDTTILQVEYTHKGEINGYGDLVVKNIVVVPKSSTSSSYDSILLSDLPWNTCASSIE